MHRSLRRRTAAALAAVPLALATLTACGGGGGAGASGGTTKITVGVIPIVDVAPIYLGIKKGFFKAEHLDVKLDQAQGGAAIVPAVVSGQYQFGFSNTTSLLLAGSQGLPLKVVTAGDNATDDPKSDFCSVVVRKGSPIKRPADLAGKKVAVNTLKNINSTTVNQMVRNDGGDPSKIQFVEMAFPDIPAAVAKGDVDAGQVVEPFATIAKQQGEVSLGSNCAGTDPGMPVADYFTSKPYMAKNPQVVKGFTSAMNKSLEYAQAHPDEARQILGTYTDIDPKVQQAMVLPVWRSKIDRAGFEKLAQMSTTDGLFKKQPDLDALLP